MSYPDYMSATEKTICNRLINSILQRGHSIEVHDECELVQVKTQDAKLVKEATCHTGITSYRVWSTEKGYVGSMLLIHGNEEDVISDYSWPQDRPEMEAELDKFFEEATGE
ncbi:MAG: hypothetical protein JJ979_02590 [Roseibium sp.]|nr:hypothetical protein [Roseibium sp.]